MKTITSKQMSDFADATTPKGLTDDQVKFISKRLLWSAHKTVTKAFRNYQDESDNKIETNK